MNDIEAVRGTNFFVAGGTLRYNSPSYVKRPADDELLEAIQAGEFCYVLTPRQMGKSSLMVRTSRRLQEEGVRTVILDLTSIGTEVTAEQWYLGIANRLATRLRLRMDVQGWWEEQGSIGVVQRFSDFLTTQVLEQIDEQIVIFVDEIDATLNIPFSDDFFAAIRAFYNERADNANFDRLSFVLLGVATPADLIKDRTRTPFNIGRRIDLKEFSPDDASVLRDAMIACYPQQGQEIFDRVFYWTNGHPYLTQRLCLSAVEEESIEDGVQWVDQEVGRLFLAEAARRETNLQFIRDYISRFPPEEQRRLLDLYGQVHSGRRVVDDDRSSPQNQLKLLGLVQAEGDRLVVRNEIYRHVFDQEWVKETRPVDWNRRMAIIAGAAVIILLAALAYSLWNQSQIDTGQVLKSAEEDFATGNPLLRMVALHDLFEWGSDETVDKAFSLIKGVDQDQRVAIFADSGDLTNLEHELRSVILPLTLLLSSIQDISGNSGSTEAPSLSNTAEDEELLAAMAGALGRTESGENQDLAEGINDWLAGRQAMKDGSWVRARIHLADANTSPLRGNPAVLYDIALVDVEMGRYEEGLAEMKEIMALDDSQGDFSGRVLDQSLTHWQGGVKGLILSEQDLYDYLWENRGSYPELIALAPEPTITLTPTLTPEPVEAEVLASMPSETPTENPSPTIMATETAITSSTPDMTATFWADCTRDLEVLDEHTYSNNTVLWAPTNGLFDLYWTLRNGGTCPWLANFSWAFVEGEDFGYSGDPILLGREVPSEDLIEIATQRVFRAPSASGYYRSTWQLVDADGNLFGQPHSFVIVVRNPPTPTPVPTSTPVIVSQPTPLPSSGGGGSSGGGNPSPTTPTVEPVPPTSVPPTNPPSSRPTPTP